MDRACIASEIISAACGCLKIKMVMKIGHPENSG